MTDEAQNYALNEPTSPTSGHNSLRFAMDMAKNAMMTCTIVKVMKVTVAGVVGPIGRVDVQPLVQMIDGIQRTTDHATVHNLPYLRMVGGKNAVIIDPKKDDIGIVVTADRDISAVKESKKMSPPGSGRRYNISDGIFLGSVIADKPTSYVQFKDNGTIVMGVGPDSSACELVVASGHVQMKKKGSSTLHITVDADGNQLIVGQTIVIGPDPYPGD